MRKILGAGLVLATAFLSAPTLAADMPVKSPLLRPDPVASWSGFYAGWHVGFGWGSADTARADGPPGPPGFDFTASVSGALAGGQIGYNFQNGNWVFGLIGDLSVAAINGDGFKAAGLPGPPAAFRTSYDWLATLRVRAGTLISPATLIYLHGGLAIADIQLDGIGGAGPWAFLTSSGTNTGWIIGLGAEWKMSGMRSLFLEYSYLDFGTRTITPAGPPGAISHHNKLHLLKGGMNFPL